MSNRLEEIYNGLIPSLKEDIGIPNCFAYLTVEQEVFFRRLFTKYVHYLTQEKLNEIYNAIIQELEWHEQIDAADIVDESWARITKNVCD